MPELVDSPDIKWNEFQNQLRGTRATSEQLLTAWANSSAYTVESLTRDGDGVLQSAQVTWPDGSTGVLTVTQVVDYAPRQVQITHAASGSTITITAPEEGA